MKLKKKMGGFVQTAELVLISTVLVTGLTVGLVNVRDAVNTELEDVAESVGALDQSYKFYGVTTSGSGAVGTANFVSGSSWTDSTDSYPADDTARISFSATSTIDAGNESGS